MFGMGWGELVVLALVGLFVLGPERLPGAIRWLGAAAAQMRSYVETAKEHIDSPEFDDVRKPFEELREPLAELRALDPRRTAERALGKEPPQQRPAAPTPTTDVPASEAR